MKLRSTNFNLSLTREGRGGRGGVETVTEASEARMDLEGERRGGGIGSTGTMIMITSLGIDMNISLTCTRGGMMAHHHRINQVNSTMTYSHNRGLVFSRGVINSGPS